MLYIRYYKWYIIIYAHTKHYLELLRFFYGGHYWLKYNLDCKCLASLGSKIVTYGILFSVSFSWTA